MHHSLCRMPTNCGDQDRRVIVHKVSDLVSNRRTTYENVADQTQQNNATTSLTELSICMDFFLHSRNINVEDAQGQLLGCNVGILNLAVQSEPPNNLLEEQ